jgi:membrane-associated phospholipid phosphatase
MHAYAIGVSAETFRRRLPAYRGKDWEAGIAFGGSPHFRKLWSWDEMQGLLLPQFSTYVPRARGHNIDPYNSGQGYYGANWGGYRPLALQDPGQITILGPGAPPPEGSPEYERDAAEVRVKGALRSLGDRFFPARTQHETHIGLFWAYDGARLIGTPPRLYNQIVRQVAIADGFNVAEMARLLALCNLAMADAAIVAWRAKYRYGVWRPVLGIPNHAHAPDQDWLPYGAPKTNPMRAAGAGRGSRNTAQALMGGGPPSRPSWPEDDRLSGPARRAKPLYRDAAFTPNFPAYPSGHATFGGACFTMLRLLRQERPRTRKNPDAIRGTFVSDELNGVTLDHATGRPRAHYPIGYRSLSDMIKDNDLSRIYLGVHWRFDCDGGSESGGRIAKAVYDAAYPSHEAY